MRRATAALVLLWASAAGTLWSAEIQETVESAFKAFLEGRVDDAIKGYRYLETLGVSLPDPDSNMAVLSRDKADNDAALALWVKSSLIEGADGFVWNQRGWSYLAEDRPGEAKDSFLKGVDRSSTTAMQAEANLGLGLSALANSQPKGGMIPLRSALVQGPYILPVASYVTGLTALSVGDKPAALAYLRQSIDLDPVNLESIRELARLDEKVGENRSAWRLFNRLLALDPGDGEALQHSKKLARFIPGDPTASLPLRRLPRPMLAPDAEGASLPKSSVTIRVGLYSGPDGKPETADRMYFMVNSNFQLKTGNETVNENGRGYDQWEIAFRPENNVVEVRDTARNIQHTAKQPFRIVPGAKQGSVLIKSPHFLNDFGFDAGDRELRGALEVIPTPNGFRLVNEIELEDYLAGAVGAALPEKSPAEAYKAQAVLSRTMVLWYKSQALPNLERTDLCDSARCQRYVGINDEARETRSAVKDTTGLVLISADGRLARVMEHENCGGRTESGLETGDPSLKNLLSVDDAPLAGLPPHTPAQLERWTHEFPPRDRFCEAGSLTAPAESRWVRIIDASELKARAERVQYIGAIKHIRVSKRSATGRALSLEVTGSRGTLSFEGPKAIEDFLSPGSLRSTLFTIQPLAKGGSAARFILWGAGTGHGLGMCRAGAIGQASLGRGWKTILATYFPGLKAENLHYKPPPPKGQGFGKGKPKNPHFKPKK
ncbi:MAG: SpoIID/LytB domain-containing protein [Elusimicrobia bacterium]|nr:SpoIID/LytB domain-containing protein [Elusimicrobiota bacterium]